MTEGEHAGSTPMPEDPRASPRQTVDALEEKVSGTAAPQEPESEQQPESEQEPEQDAAAIDPDEHEPGSMHRATEPPV